MYSQVISRGIGIILKPKKRVNGFRAKSGAYGRFLTISAACGPAKCFDFAGQAGMVRGLLERWASGISI
jgi:hypothetical protein